LRDLPGAETLSVTNRTVFLVCGATAVILIGGCGSPAGRGDPERAAAAEPVATAEPQARTLAVERTAAPEESAKLPRAAATPSLVEIRTVTRKVPIAYATRTVKDSNLRKGKREVRTKGVPGTRMLTYRVTLTNGRQTATKLIKSELTRKPVTKVVAVGTKEADPRPGCDPNYSGACVPVASDVDCAGGSGNGPAYVDGPVRVIGSDIYDLDRDGDGIGCDA
jgi:resuscitation-promoting factor RpfB